MINYRRIMLCAALVGSAVVVRAAGESQKGDSWVTAKTKIALFADSRVKGREISVETKAGVVMLRGKVETSDAKDAAGEIAKSVDGATSVKNELQVVPSSDKDVVAVKDDAILAHVQARMKHIPGAHVTVQVNDGAVSLSGDVDTLTHSAQASWKAYTVKGVHSVKNDLTVKS